MNENPHINNQQTKTGIEAAREALQRFVARTEAVISNAKTADEESVAIAVATTLRAADLQIDLLFNFKDYELHIDTLAEAYQALARFTAHLLSTLNELARVDNECKAMGRADLRGRKWRDALARARDLCHETAGLPIRGFGPYHP